MSLERILIIKQYQETNLLRCKTGLESSPEKYSVVIANTYRDGQYLLRERSRVVDERFSAVIVDADEVDNFVLELLASIKGMNDYREYNYYMPVIVMTSLADIVTRQMLSSMSTECII